jgi:hypothetical protein
MTEAPRISPAAASKARGKGNSLDPAIYESIKLSTRVCLRNADRPFPLYADGKVCGTAERIAGEGACPDFDSPTVGKPIRTSTHAFLLDNESVGALELQFFSIPVLRQI